MDHQFPYHVCRLHKFLYGLKQAPRTWFDRFTSQLLHLGFEASMANSSLFVYHSHQIIIYLLVYVDDIIITGNSSSQVSHLVTALSKVFELKGLGSLCYFLGIQIVPSRFGLTLCQSKYASYVLHRFNMENSKPTKTPCCPNVLLTPFDGYVLPDPSEYRSMVDALQYLTFTRPDLAFSVHQLCQFMHHPTTSHLEAAKRVLCYVRGIYILEFTLLLVLSPSLPFLTQIGMEILLTRSLLLGCWFSLVLAQFLGLLRNNPLFPILPQRQSIAHWLQQ